MIWRNDKKNQNTATVREKRIFSFFHQKRSSRSERHCKGEIRTWEIDRKFVEFQNPAQELIWDLNPKKRSTLVANGHRTHTHYERNEMLTTVFFISLVPLSEYCQPNNDWCCFFGMTSTQKTEMATTNGPHQRLIVMITKMKSSTKWHSFTALGPANIYK